MSDLRRICQTTSDLRTQIFRTFFEYVLKISVLISTLFYLPAPQGMTGQQAIEFGYQIQELFFRYSVVVIFAVTMFYQPRRKINFSSLAVFIILSVLIGIVSGMDIQNRRTILNIFMASVLYKSIVEYADVSQKSIKTWATWIFWLLFANLLLAICQKCGSDPIFSHVRQAELGPWRDGIGFFKLKSTLGNFSAVVAPILMILNPFLLIVTIPLLFYGQSSAAILAFIVGVCIVAHYRYPKFVFYSLVLAILGTGIFYIFKVDMPGGQFMKRLPIWWVTFSETLRFNPFTGFGLGKFMAFQPVTIQNNLERTPETWIWAHNDFLQLFFEGGIILLTSLLVFLKKMIADFFRFKDRVSQILFASVVAIIIVGFFHFPFHLARTAVFFVVILALFQARIEQNKLTQGH